jgi:hypothetical protein
MTRSHWVGRARLLNAVSILAIAMFVFLLVLVACRVRSEARSEEAALRQALQETVAQYERMKQQRAETYRQWAEEQNHPAGE